MFKKVINDIICLNRCSNSDYSLSIDIKNFKIIQNTVKLNSTLNDYISLIFNKLL